MNAATEVLIDSYCRFLRMPDLGRIWRKACDESVREKRTPAEFLRFALEEEVQGRESRRVGRRIKGARFPIVKTIEAFDFAAAPWVEASTVAALVEGHFIDARENVLFLGPVGTGKTHLATALAVAACQRSRRVRFATATGLIAELVEIRARGELGRAVARLGRLDLLIVDELGYVPLAREGAELLYQVFSERHERGSVIVTTNLPFKDWGTVFPDVRMAGALLDRLTHRAHIFETKGESYRLRQSLARRAKATRATR